MPTWLARPTRTEPVPGQPFRTSSAGSTTPQPTRSPGQALTGRGDLDRAGALLAPIVADAEAGFGGVLNAYELMKGMTPRVLPVFTGRTSSPPRRSAANGGKVLVPTSQHIKTLNAAARRRRRRCAHPGHRNTDAQAATLLTSDVERDRQYLTGERTSEGFFKVRNGLEPCITRALAYAPYADLIWMETSTPDLELARKFAEAVKAEYPDQMLAYNCSPSFNWKKHLDDATIAKFQRELGHMGYKFQFITLAGFHALNYSMFDLAKGYASDGMTAFVDLQEREFAAEERGYTATKHQREVGTGWFDLVSTTLNPESSTTALTGSTEEEQF